MDEKLTEYTVDEVREKFLEYIWATIAYWEREGKTRHDAMTGLAFSILVGLDGGSTSLPGFVVAPDPHPDDREYHLSERERWFPEVKTPLPCDISGCLHELFYNYDPSKRR